MFVCVEGLLFMTEAEFKHQAGDKTFLLQGKGHYRWVDWDGGSEMRPRDGTDLDKSMIKASGLWLLMTRLSEAQYLLGCNTDGQCQDESLTSEYEIFRFGQIKSSFRFWQF